MHQDADTNTSKKQITAMLVKFKNKQALLNVPRSINDNTLMQAAVPSIELNRLRYLLESGSKTLQLVGYALLILAILSLMVTLLQLFEDRKYELALLKAQGASFNKLIMLLFTENIMLAVPGWFLGELIARIGFSIMNKNLNSSFHFTINPLEITGMDFYLLGLLVFFAMITALLPVLRLKKLNVITILSAN
jgi:putative ABC transport system permease protein